MGGAAAFGFLRTQGLCVPLPTGGGDVWEGAGGRGTASPKGKPTPSVAGVVCLGAQGIREVTLSANCVPVLVLDTKPSGIPYR